MLLCRWTLNRQKQVINRPIEVCNSLIISVSYRQKHRSTNLVLSANKLDNQAFIRLTPNFTPTNVKLGVFYVFLTRIRHHKHSQQHFRPLIDIS
jgi:hypothetical protein